MPTVVKDAYGTPTTIQYGKLGREYHRYNGLGSWQTTLYYGFPSLNCPSGTKVTVRTQTAEGQELDTCLDAVGRTILAKGSEPF